MHTMPVTLAPPPSPFNDDFTYFPNSFKPVLQSNRVNLNSHIFHWQVRIVVAGLKISSILSTTTCYPGSQIISSTTTESEPMYAMSSLQQ